MPSTDGLTLRLSQTFASAGLQTLRSDAVPRGMTWRIDSVVWDISLATSGGNTRCRLYVDRATEKQVLDEQLIPVANWLYTHRGPDYLHPGERLAMEIDQGQASNLVTLTARGQSIRA